MILLIFGFSLFFVIFGLLYLIYKPYYNPDEKVHLRKTTNTQGIILFLTGIVFLLVYFFGINYDIKKGLPYFLIITILIVAFLMARIPGWYKEVDQSNHIGYDRSKYQKRNQMFRKYIFVYVIIVLLLTFFYAGWMPSRILENDTLVIKGMYGFKKGINDLVIIDTVSALPRIYSSDKGISVFNTAKGSFVIDNNEKARMYVYDNKPPFIYIEYRRANKLYLNFRDTEQTKKFYRQLKVKKEKGFLP